MSDVTVTARLMHGLSGGLLDLKGDAALDAPIGRLIVAGRGYEIRDALHRIAQALGWVTEGIDAVRTNLNDLDWESPLSSTVSFAGSSDRTWLFVVDGVNDRFLADEPSMRRLRRIAMAGPVVVVVDALPDRPVDGWGTLDLTGSTS